MKYYGTTLLFSSEYSEFCVICSEKCPQLVTENPMVFQATPVCVRCRLCTGGWVKHFEDDISVFGSGVSNEVDPDAPVPTFEPCRNCFVYGSQSSSYFECDDSIISKPGLCNECNMSGTYGIDNVSRDDYLKYLNVFCDEVDENELDPRVRFFLIRSNTISCSIITAFEDALVEYEELDELIECDLDDLFDCVDEDINHFVSYLYSEMNSHDDGEYESLLKDIEDLVDDSDSDEYYYESEDSDSDSDEYYYDSSDDEDEYYYYSSEEEGEVKRVVKEVVKKVKELKEEVKVKELTTPKLVNDVTDITYEHDENNNVTGFTVSIISTYKY